MYNKILKPGLGLLLVFALFQACSKGEKKMDIKGIVENEFKTEQGEFAMAFKNLETNETLLINADTRFHAASTMKTPVMIEVYKQAAAGKFSLTDSITIKNDFKSIVDGSPYSLSTDDDSETELYTKLGEKRTISDLIYDMIIVSSNLATNLVIEWVDAKKVTETMRSLGAKDIEVLRGVEDIKAFEKGLSNSTTANDLMNIFEKMALGKAVNPEADQQMIEILKDQKFNEIIPAHLPEGVAVAHKTGVITGVHHDSGIVYLPDGTRYVLILLSKNMTDFDAGTAMMAKVSKHIYDYVTHD